MVVVGTLAGDAFLWAILVGVPALFIWWIVTVTSGAERWEDFMEQRMDEADSPDPED